MSNETTPTKYYEKTRQTTNSFSPPSELSLSEDILIPENNTQRWSSYAERQINQQHYTDEQAQIDNFDSSQQQKQSEQHNSYHYHQQDRFGNDLESKHRRALEAINTDYESSAAEDLESYKSIKYKNADYALLSFSRTNKLEKLKALLNAKLEEGLNVNLNYKGQQKQNFSWSALHLACYFGHLEVVQLLLSNDSFKNEIDINIQNNSGDTPLHKATLTNRVQIVQLLLSNGANVFIKNCDSQMAKQLTNNTHILEMLSAAEQVDRNKLRQEMFKAVDCGDLRKLQEYFENVCSFTTETSNSKSSESSGNVSGSQKNSSLDRNSEHLTNEMISQITDDRGNTLLHLAAMKGFKAICVYLLEQGFDPYRKNNLGQTCIDLSSYQLRQLFTTVKPANSRLKKLSNNRVSRFEGPLLKKVRILGWKQIYVVLENGVILLFNNRIDSMNRSRRGYKYLESAICEPDFNVPGQFSLCFSDRSRATFLVSLDHLGSYTSFKFNNLEQDKSAKNQIELLRQKWIDSIRDHITYSTNFIRNGLKLNDNEDENDNYQDDGDLTTLNHLLPVDTIKSFMQEARAHYSILGRHADSLCNLIQSISTTNRLVQSTDMNQHDEMTIDSESQSTITSNTSNNPPTLSTGSRILGFIRPSRQSRGNSMSNNDSISTISVSTQPSTSSTRKRNNSLTNEFIQDNWHCILFHLRLLMESTENTKVSMGQALALLEHQEQLRQNKIQDQEERCRVLEDSLHALARDHHELEKSISMSQIYHSVAATRSVSMSTDLNEYFDAFEDFDDEKTVTPNSMPSDEDISRRIDDLMNDDDAPPTMLIGKPDESKNQSTSDSRPNRCSSNNAGAANGNERNGYDQGNREYNFEEGEDEDEEDDDDVQSNCSALTIETVSEIQLVNNNQEARLSAGSNVASSGADKLFETNTPAGPTTGENELQAQQLRPSTTNINANKHSLINVYHDHHHHEQTLFNNIFNLEFTL